MIWRGKGFPEKWREGLIAPIYKKGETGDVRNYRGLTLLCTAYKVYAAIDRKIKERDGGENNDTGNTSRIEKEERYHR